MNGAPVLMVDNFNFEPQPVLYSQAVLHVTKTDENAADILTRPTFVTDASTATYSTPRTESRYPSTLAEMRRHLDAIHPFPPMPALE